jgi:hypothetical protein
MGFLREPIVHFLAAGLILFGVYNWSSVEPETRGADDPYRITLSQETLVSFIQGRTKIADPAQALRAIGELDDDARKGWIDRYVREEVLVREARSLGLDREDSIIRRRLAQKIEFLTLGLLEEELRIDEGELDAFYQEHGEDYRIPTTLTFTHVFVGEPDDSGRSRAESLMDALNSKGVSFRDSSGLGDRFLYNRNYVDRTIEEVRSHFGDEFGSQLDKIDPSAKAWAGPYRSSHGWHVVLLTRRATSRIPEAEEILGPLRDDAKRAKRERVLDQAIDVLVAKYQVDLKRLDSD